MLAVFLLLFMIVYFATISVAVRRHFVSKSVSPAMKLVSAISLATIARTIWLIHSDPPPAFNAISALILTVVAAALFEWARRQTAVRRPLLAYDTGQPAHLYTEGPYRWVRHPFYASYLLFWSAAAIAARDPWVAVGAGSLLVLYARAAIAEEQSFSGTPLAEDYARYRLRTGAFLPRIARGRT